MHETEYDHPFLAETYDFVVPYRTRPDANFFIETAEDSGGPVLELGCGTGRVLIPTARAGIEITGLDESETMLNVCRKHLQEESAQVRARIQLVQGRMQHFALNKAFRLVTIPFRPFQHLLTVEDQISCLQNVHVHLEKNGRLILDIYNPWIHMMVADDIGTEYGTEPEFTMPDGRKVIRKHRATARDLFNQINYLEMIYEVTYPDGKIERIVRPFQMRHMFRFEAEHLLARCGFALEHVYADYDKTPYGKNYPGELIMVARRT